MTGMHNKLLILPIKSPTENKICIIMVKVLSWQAGKKKQASKEVKVSRTSLLETINGVIGRTIIWKKKQKRNNKLSLKN